jgi:hypothetical protein
MASSALATNDSKGPSAPREKTGLGGLEEGHPGKLSGDKYHGSPAQGSELRAMRAVSKTANPGSNPGSPAQ